MTEMLSTVRQVRRATWLLSAVIVVLVGGLALSVIDSFASPAQKTLTVSGSSHGTASAPVPQLIVHGSSPKGLAPGVTKRVVIRIRNPHHQRLLVTSASIKVGNASATCTARKNIRTTSYHAQIAGGKRYHVYLHHRVHIPLTLTMLDLRTNQDACKGVHFPLTFNATGRKG